MIMAKNEMKDSVDVVGGLENPPSVAEKIDAAIHEWVVANIYNCPVSQNTEAYNQLHFAIPDLKKRLLEALRD